MIEWVDQVLDGMWSASVATANLYVGRTINTDPKPFFWEVQIKPDVVPSQWGYADTLDEAKALAIANYALNGV